jgi:cyclohexyl-isocyanide hydratase
LEIVATETFRDARPVDVLFVPGGPGVGEAMEDDALVGFLEDRAREAKWITAVCTGALVLGAAGLLEGYRATTHWLSMELLGELGAAPVGERVVIDRNRITGGGVTAGIDFALTVAATIAGARAAMGIQLMLEYDPMPPFDAGGPHKAPPDLVEEITASRRAVQERRREIVERVRARRVSAGR